MIEIYLRSTKCSYKYCQYTVTTPYICIYIYKPLVPLYDQRPPLKPTGKEPYKPSARIPFPVTSPARTKISWFCRVTPWNCTRSSAIGTCPNHNSYGKLSQAQNEMLSLSLLKIYEAFKPQPTQIKLHGMKHTYIEID